ncbi:MAG TPA: hypothetical protein VHN17_08765 [Steroidobacteraceae bacterium]|nr:hypothetical protein [Steroidobacteraceae bacterium]
MSSSSGGQSGVFVIPSSSLAATPTWVSTSTASLFLGYGLQVTLNGSNAITAFSPATYMYAAVDTSNNLHVYGLNLASSSTPTATQIGSLSLPLTPGAAVSTVICDSREASTNLFDGTTLFVALHIAGTGGCNTTGDVWEVVHYTDSSSAAPTVVGIKSTAFTPLYDATGALTGLELFDSVSGNLYLYANDGFTSPTTLVAGVTAASTVINSEAVNGGAAFTGNELFLSVTTAAGNYLYRLPHGVTTATKEYTATGTLTGIGVADGVNVYFNDTVSGATSTTTLWAEPLSGGTPTELYSVSYPATVSYNLLGANTSVLVFYSTTISGSSMTSTLLSVPVTTLSTSATTIGGPFTGGIFSSSSFLEPTTAGDPSTNLVFVNVLNVTSGGGGTTFSYSSEALTPGGTVKKALTSNSVFLYNAASFLSGSALQITGITDTAGGYGGGTFNAVNLGTLASTALTTTGGASYTVPAGFVAGFGQLANTIGAGVLAPVSGSSAAALGGAYDLSKDLIVPISLTNTNVALF